MKAEEAIKLSKTSKEDLELINSGLLVEEAFREIKKACTLGHFKAIIKKDYDKHYSDHIIKKELENLGYKVSFDSSSVYIYWKHVEKPKSNLFNLLRKKDKKDLPIPYY